MTKKKMTKKLLALILCFMLALPMASFATGESAPAIPVRLGMELVSTVELGSGTRSVCAYGNYVYLADRNRGLLVYDYSDKKNPVLVYEEGNDGTYNAMCDVDMRENMMIDGSNLYVAYDYFEGNSVRSPQIKKYSLAENPAKPTLVATLMPKSGTQIFSFTVLSDGKGVLASARSATLSNYWADTTVGGTITSETPNVTHDSAPMLYSKDNLNFVIRRDGNLYFISSTISTAALLMNGPWYSVHKEGNYVYILGDGFLRVVDISDYVNGSTTLPNVFKNADNYKDINYTGGFEEIDATAINPHATRWGNYLIYRCFSSASGQKVLAFDISRPNAPVEAGVYGTGSTFTTHGMSAVSGNYLYTTNGASNAKLYAIKLTSDDDADIQFENITETDTDNSMVYDYTIENPYTYNETFTVVHAAYKGDRLLGVDIEDVLVPADTADYVVKADLVRLPTLSQIEERYRYERFVWDSMERMIPQKNAQALYVDLTTPVTRLTAFYDISKLLGLPDASYGGTFTDLGACDFAPALQALYNAGYMTEGTTIKANLTYSEMVTAFQKAYAALGGTKANYIADGIDYDSSMASAWVKFSDYSKALRLVKHGNGRPTIIRIADEIAPGELFTVYGDMMEKNCKVYIEPASTAGATPSASARKVAVKQVDMAGAFVVAELPEDAAGGVYKIWVENEAGLSDPVLLNQPRPFWMGLSDVYLPGQTAQVAGANLLPSEVEDMTGYLRVKMTNGSTVYTPEIVENNPYCVKFTVPENAAVGTYTLSFSADGVNWTGLESDQTLTVKTGSDPYGLGVGWAANYKYERKISVKDKYNYGLEFLGGYPAAKGNGTADDTATINAVIKRVHDAGGGIAYLPAGTYSVRYIALYDNVILEGEGQGKTTILYRAPNSGENQFIYSHRTYGQQGYQGFYNLTIKLDETPDKWRDCFFWIGDEGIRPWSWNKEFEGFFMKNVDLVSRNQASPKISGVSTRMITYATIDKYFMLDNVNAYSTESKEGHGKIGGFMPVYGDYVTVRNGVVRSIGSTHEDLGLYNIYEDNTILRENTYKWDNDYTDEDTTKDDNHYAQGVFTRSHFYIADNVFKNLGGAGQETCDGEIIASENSNNGSVKMNGKITAATPTTITISPDMARKQVTVTNSDGTTSTEWQYQIRCDLWGDGANARIAPGELDACWGKHHAVIIAGKGIGQEVPVKRLMSENLDGTYTYELEEAWKILPDETSRVIIMTLTKHGIMYNNYAENAQKGYWIYNGGFDNIIADNKGKDIEGIMVRSLEILHDGNRIDNVMPSYFTLIKDNELDGYVKSTDSSQASCISIVACYEVSDAEHAGKTAGVSSFGTVIKGNTVKNADSYEHPVNPSEGPNSNGILVVSSPTYSAPQEANVKSVIIEDNILSNNTHGIHVGGATKTAWNQPTDDGYHTYEGFYIRNNSMADVDNEWIGPRENGRANFINEQ